MNQLSYYRVRYLIAGAIYLSMCACAPLGPDFAKPNAPHITQWPDDYRAEFDYSPQTRVEWWHVLDDPVLDNLVSLAHDQNNNLTIAGLRVLEARAILGIAVGNQYPQSQLVFGGQYYITDQWSVGGSLKLGDDTTSLFLGGRFNFGGLTNSGRRSAPAP